MNRITQYFPLDDLFGENLDEAALFAFDGRELDSAAGLQNHFMRHCDTVVGVWLDESPVGCEADVEERASVCALTIKLAVVRKVYGQGNKRTC